MLKDWKVVIVDDDLKSLEIMRLLLRHYGLEIHIAKNGKEGLEVATKVHPHFIISDLSMPVMDGWQMLEALKKDPTTAEIPVFALTAHAMFGDRERALNAGFVNYLTKPISPQTFMDDLITRLNAITRFAEMMKQE